MRERADTDGVHQSPYPYHSISVFLGIIAVQTSRSALTMQAEILSAGGIRLKCSSPFL